VLTTNDLKLLIQSLPFDIEIIAQIEGVCPYVVKKPEDENWKIGIK
jgi:hypothetical protein